MSDFPGLGVLIHALFDDNQESVSAHEAAKGKTIQSMALRDEDDILYMRFTDGTGIQVYDDGQSCYEKRYMTTDDDLNAFAGAIFTGLELRDGGEVEGDEIHEIQFLLINTSLGVATVETHNEHNGYYGGFWIVVRELT